MKRKNKIKSTINDLNRCKIWIEIDITIEDHILIEFKEK